MKLIGLGTVYMAILVLLLLNGFFVYSLIGRFQESGKAVPEDETALVEGSIAGDRTIRVEVLNGAGVGGIARKMTDFLRRVGFDVIDFGNAESFEFYETVVLDRSGDWAAAERVARAVDVKNILEQKNPYLALDVTLILGRDYRKLAAFQHKRREQ